MLEPSSVTGSTSAESCCTILESAHDRSGDQRIYGSVESPSCDGTDHMPTRRLLDEVPNSDHRFAHRWCAHGHWRRCARSKRWDECQRRAVRQEGNDNDCDFKNPKNHNSKDHTKGDKNHNSKDHITRGNTHTKNQNSKDHTKGDKNHNSKDHIIRGGDDDCGGGNGGGGNGGGGGRRRRLGHPGSPCACIVPAVLPPTVVAPAPVANVTEPAPEEEPPADVVQEPRQLNESELPFTGFAAIPLMLFGFAMLAGGLALRRSMRGRASGLI